MLADETYNDKNKNWKLFVKMARCFRTLPDMPGVGVFHGLLHDCDANLATELDKGAAPKPDDDGWDQYGFKDADLLGECRLFIEFYIDWEHWDDSNKSRFEFDI
ncbi:hypothetical protein SEMRO_1331_G263560.1 [Seminavis robusta]|uniref:Uncharacterized protein n=1 Tax=Seminavis robusta TaxID=568900 RepID=A0A9N8HS06_9STRA|nr:hypothetical protein SEMRO_1331_G263560.1 [Seminavis robusta]|eukprot:Sro1331_g263560.1 n/a (104) ;mRNA; r:29281-29592